MARSVASRFSEMTDDASVAQAAADVEGTDAIVTLATEPPTAGTGRYIDRFGPVPW